MHMKQINEEKYSIVFKANVMDDEFIHFTPLSRCDSILSSGKLLMDPPYRKFGTDTVNAVSLTYGKYLSTVQHDHLKGDELVAIIFKTDTIPKVGFVEEVAWKQDVNLINPRVITFDTAKEMLSKVKPIETPMDHEGYKKDFWVEYGDEQLNESTGNMKYINFLNKITTSDNAILIESLKDAYQLCFEGEYFNETIPEEDKRRSCVYNGRAITWYGIPGKMVVVHKDIITGMWGNDYNQDKLDELEDMFTYSEDMVEIECSYGIGSIVNFTDICEQRQAYKDGSFAVDYDGQDEPYSLGDDELDMYVTDVGIDEVVFGGYYESVYSNEIEKALESSKLDIASGKYSVEATLEEAWYQAQSKADIIEDNIEFMDEDDKKTLFELKQDFGEAFKEFVRIELDLKAAIDSEQGDLGDPTIQLQDSHHRVMSAIKSGEQYVCVNISGESDTDFTKKISESNLINFVTKKYVPE